MDKGQRTIAATRIVIAVMLGLNLVATGERAAEGQVVAGPVEPMVVGVSVGQVFGTAGVASWRVFRQWSDGAVDTTLVDFAGPGVGNCNIDSVCGPFSVLPGSCPADIDHNGETDFDDLLEVLSTYGPCP